MPKSASRTRSVVGRVARPFGARRAREQNLPPVTRIAAGRVTPNVAFRASPAPSISFLPTGMLRRYSVPYAPRARLDSHGAGRLHRPPLAIGVGRTRRREGHTRLRVVRLDERRRRPG